MVLHPAQEMCLAHFSPHRRKAWPTRQSAATRGRSLLVVSEMWSERSDANFEIGTVRAKSQRVRTSLHLCQQLVLLLTLTGSSDDDNDFDL